MLLILIGCWINYLYFLRVTCVSPNITVWKSLLVLNSFLMIEYVLRCLKHYGTNYDTIIIYHFRHLVTSAPNKVHRRNCLAAYMEFVDAAQRIRATFREHAEKEIKEFKLFNQGAEARKRVCCN